MVEDPKVDPALPNPGAAADPKVEAKVDPKVEDPKPKADSQEEGKDPSLMDEAVDQDKVKEEAENKRLLDTPLEKLSDEEKTKRIELEKANKEKEDTKVPEKYEFKVPDGMELNQELVDETSKVFKELGLPQSKADKLIALAEKQLQASLTKQAAASEANFKQFVEDLRKETVAKLSEGGKDYQAELAFAAKSRNKFASPELIEKLNKSGLTNDIDVVSHFIKLGKMISEGTLVEAPGGGVGKPNPLDILYPNTNKK